MSDIVDRARDMHASAADSCDPAYNRILLEMATEIERLRAVLKGIAASSDVSKGMQAVAREALKQARKG